MKAESRKQNKCPATTLFLHRRNLVSVSVMLFSFTSCVDADRSEPIKQTSEVVKQEQIKVADSVVVDSDIPESEKPADLTKLVFKHPLQGVKLINGKVPGVDIHDSPINGKRFAIGELTTQHDESVLPKTISGVFEWDVGPIKTNKVVSDHFYTHLSKAPKAKIRPSLDALINTSKQSDLIDVRIRIVDDYQLEHAWHRLDREIGLGNIKMHSDFERVRNRIMDERRVHFATAKQPVVDILKRWNVYHVALKNLNFVHAKIPVSRIGELEKLASVFSISVSHPISVGSVNQCPIGSWLDAWIDGVEVVQGTQIQQLLCNGDDGQPPSGAYRVAVFEEGVPWPATNLLDWAGGPNRLKDAKGCGFFYCNNTDSGDIDQHSTEVINLIAGDLTQNQQPNITIKKEQVRRSGYSPEAEIYAYALENGAASFETAVDHVLARSSLPLVASSSWGINASHWFHDCNGDWDEDEALNSMYEAGIFPVVLAGNEFASGDCDVWVPGAALSAFTVGGHLYNRYSLNDSITGVQSRALFFKSAYGREVGRNVIELTAPAYREKNPSGFTLTPVTQLWEKEVGGTSYAAPTVTAAALNFADFYETNYSTWIRNPGALFSSMLLMGDRQTNSGTKTNTAFDPSWGGGRMLMRMFNGAGMDSPWGYGRYSVCVDHDKEVSYELTNLPTDVDNLIVVAHWFDRRHDNTGSLADIDLKVEIYDDSEIVQGALWSNVSRSSKERVRYPMNNINTELHAKLTLQGYKVFSNNAGCGSNSMKVYISWYYEDNDRDDSNGPGMEILPQ